MTAEHYEELEIFALAQDPIYIGTGGYTLGRVDNTIVRDKATNLPKIPGSSLAGTWRYYVVLELLPYLKNVWKKVTQSSNLKNYLKNRLNEIFAKGILNQELKNILESALNNLQLENSNNFRKVFYTLALNICQNNKKIECQELKDILLSLFIPEESNNSKQWKNFKGNSLASIKCAGQDDAPNLDIDSQDNTGHCGYCIVCKGFGFSKKNLSWQGQLFFNDLHIALFPVFTAEGTKWITTERIINEVDNLFKDDTSKNKINIESIFYILDRHCEETKNYINLGWLYLPYVKRKDSPIKQGVGKLLYILNTLIPTKGNEFQAQDIFIVPEHLFAHVVNSNLEVRTSVSIDPVTGAAKEGALFTTEAIPRGTVFYGQIYIFDRKNFEDLEPKIKPLPDKELLKEALKDSSHYYESLGIGGMTTRGFGRLKIWSPQWEKKSNGGNNDETSG